MPNDLLTVSSWTLKKAAALLQRIEALQRKLAQTLGGEIPTPSSGRRTMSRTARARLAAQARWARHRTGRRSARAPEKRSRKMSAAARAAISARLKARWAKIKRAGGKRLIAV